MDPTTLEIDALSPAAPACGVLRGISQRTPKCPQHQEPCAIASLPDELIVLIAETLDAPSLASFAAVSTFCLAAAHGELRAALLAAVQRCLTHCATFGAGVACPHFRLPDDLVEAKAFMGRDFLTHVKNLPIGETFSSTSHRQLILPAGLDTIKPGAFRDCYMRKLVLPAALTTLDIDAFFGCRSLTDVDISGAAALTRIGRGVFRNCSSLCQLVLPAAVTTIGMEAFEHCGSLTLATLPAALTSIGDNAFAYCTSLALTGLPDGITNIGRRAFMNCTSLALTGLPDGITNIGRHAFSDCTALALTGLPDGLTSIGESAFYECPFLALTNLPDGLTSIGDEAFYGCHRFAVTRHSLPPTATPFEVYTLEVAEENNKRNRARRER